MKSIILAVFATLVQAGPEPYLRVTESEDGSTIALEVAIRTFSHVNGPELHMAAAVHIGEPSFYDAVQAFLDTQDVVL
ncbi:MAG: hypothetical protein KDA28_10920, partial [Phycisphaerales bacterium]|nr:hypothetical protein [Phycisphaerales bacterium]